VPGVDESLAKLNVEGFESMIQNVVKDFPFQVVATTLRQAKTATRNDWGAICYYDGTFYQAQRRDDLEIYDRVGGGDSFAAGLIYGFLTDKGPQWAVECGAAHGALAMTTPGDTTTATLKEVLQVMKGGAARIAR
jgi:2-dehydro-3-deoxygluconokinase